jgi:hypothetical protein
MIRPGPVAAEGPNDPGWTRRSARGTPSGCFERGQWIGVVAWPVLRLPSGVSDAFGWAFPHAAFSPDGDYLYCLTDDECSRYALGDTCRTLEGAARRASRIVRSPLLVH